MLTSFTLLVSSISTSRASSFHDHRENDWQPVGSLFSSRRDQFRRVPARQREVSPHDLRIKGAAEIGTRERAENEGPLRCPSPHASTRHFLTTACGLSDRVLLVARRTFRALRKKNGSRMRIRDVYRFADLSMQFAEVK
jgi:hypothetical protein